MAFTVSSGIVTFFILCCGFVVNINTIPPALSWIVWIDPVKYGFQSLVQNEFEGQTYACPQKDYIPYGLDFPDRGTTLLPLAVDWDKVQEEIDGKRVASIIKGEIWTGCNSGAKRTLDQSNNYLGIAISTGNIEVRELHVVQSIGYNESVNLYEVDIKTLNQDGSVNSTKKMRSSRLFLEAGSIGTTAMLVRARDSGQMPKLNQYVGTRWSSNGNQGAFRFVSPGARRAGPASVRINSFPPLSQLSQDFGRITVENLPFRYGKSTPEKFRQLDDAVFTVCVGIPWGTGNFTYDREGDGVVLNWPEDHSADRNVYYAFKEVIRTLDASLPGSVSIMQNISGSLRATVHPLGGMPLGYAIDMACRVKGYSGLYVTDSSILPGSSGSSNPSGTIASMSERCLDIIIKEDFASLVEVNSTDSDIETVPVIIIGSGFGGSIASRHLAEIGQKAVVLEKGRWWNVTDPTKEETFPTSEINDGRKAWFRKYIVLEPNEENTFNFPIDPYPGLAQLVNKEYNPLDPGPRIKAKGISVIAGVGVGGTTLVYNAITYLPIKENFELAFGNDPMYNGLWEELDSIYFPRVRTRLNATVIPSYIGNSIWYEEMRAVRDNAIAATDGCAAPLSGDSILRNLHLDKDPSSKFVTIPILIIFILSFYILAFVCLKYMYR